MMLAQIMEIGRLCAEWTWRLSYRPSILTGAKVRRGSAQGGLGRKGALEPGTNQVLEEMARLVESGKKVKEAAEILARKALVPAPPRTAKLGIDTESCDTPRHCHNTLCHFPT